MVAMIEDRHRRRLKASQSAYRKQAETLAAIILMTNLTK
jgi:hypothetical protein